MAVLVSQGLECAAKKNEVHQPVFRDIQFAPTPSEGMNQVPHSPLMSLCYSHILLHTQGVMDLLVLGASGIVYVFRNIGIQKINEGSVHN